MRIKSIQHGDKWYRSGEGEPYDTIIEELKPVGWGNGGKYEIIVYRFYDKDKNMLMEVEANNKLTILYKK